MSEIIKVPQNFSPREYQIPLLTALDSGFSRAFIKWHRRAGKDLVCTAHVFRRMVAVPGIYYYFFPNYQQGRKALWENKYDGLKFLDMIPKSLIKRINNQEMLIETFNDSIFRVIGTDNIDTIMGTNPNGVVFSEYSLQDPRAWEFIRPILTVNKGWAIFNGTPRGKNHMYKLDKRVIDNPRWYYQELQTLWPEKENYSGIVTPEDIQEERDTGMDEITIEQEYGVSYNAGMKGSIYKDHIEKAVKEGRVGDYPYDSNLPVNTYWDLGYNDPCSIWFVQHHGSKVVFIDYWEEKNKQIPDVVEILREKGFRYSHIVLPWDGDHNYGLVSTRREMLEECLEGYRIDAQVSCAGKFAREVGIEAVQARFSKYFFNESTCADALDKLSSYHRKYDAKRDIYLKEPVHDHTSHCADALRTEALAEEFYEDAYRKVQKIQVMPEFDPLADY